MCLNSFTCKPSILFCGTWADNTDPDKTPRNSASDQGIHCLHTEDSIHIWITMQNTTHQSLKLKWTGPIDKCRNVKFHSASRDNGKCFFNKPSSIRILYSASSISWENASLSIFTNIAAQLHRLDRICETLDVSSVANIQSKQPPVRLCWYLNNASHRDACT